MTNFNLEVAKCQPIAEIEHGSIWIIQNYYDYRKKTVCDQVLQCWWKTNLKYLTERKTNLISIITAIARMLPICNILHQVCLVYGV